uniref:Kallikrein related peptidase 10 n=1 Tax=Macaca mulatta TaxID=9544 RepID=A0A5F7ZZP3_MACMU
MKRGCFGHWEKPVFQGPSQSRNLGPRSASLTHGIIRQREREGGSPGVGVGEGGEASGLLRVKREGPARGPWAEDTSGGPQAGQRHVWVPSLLPIGDSQVKLVAPHPGWGGLREDGWGPPGHRQQPAWSLGFSTCGTRKSPRCKVEKEAPTGYEPWIPTPREKEGETPGAAWLQQGRGERSPPAQGGRGDAARGVIRQILAMRPPHLHLSAASGARALAKLLPLLMAQLWAAEAVLLPQNDTRLDPAAYGAPCARGSQPWQVSLFNGLSFHCAGVLVDQSWVLTAAHCGNKPLWARVGDDHLLLLQGEQLRRTTRSVVHPKYHQGSGPILPRRTDEHDLMLLKLARPVVPGPRVRALQLPYHCAQPGDQCQVAGWGTTAARRVKYNKGLTCSSVTILSPKECEVFYPGVVTNNMICAGLDRGQDPCQVGSERGESLTPGRGRQGGYGKRADPVPAPQLHSQTHP